MSPRNDHPDVIIRPATEADAAAIGTMWYQLVQHHVELDSNLPVPSEQGAELYARRITEKMDDSHARVLVAEDDGQIIGFVLGMIVDMVPEMFMETVGGFLADIYIEETYRQSGIGRQLVDHLTQWFRSRGVQYIEWYVAAQNTDARAFWEAINGRDIMIRMRVDI